MLSRDAVNLPPVLNDFLALFLGLIVEAFPFIILGVVVSGIVSLVLKPDTVAKYMPKNRLLSHVGVSFAGIFMPVCECGNVPVVRRLVMNGFSVSQAITFLLAAPILNPITIWSTAEAFGWDSEILLARVLGAFVIAVGVGLIFSLVKDQNQLLDKEFYDDYCDVDHHHHDHEAGGMQQKIFKLVDVMQQEFGVVMPALIFGAGIAAASQSFIPQSVITSIGGNAVTSVLAMLILAFVISVCANVDAFIALSYSNAFTSGSLVAFLVFGPMIDIKILWMLRTTFKNIAPSRVLALVKREGVIEGGKLALMEIWKYGVLWKLSVLVLLFSACLGLLVNVLV